MDGSELIATGVGGLIGFLSGLGTWYFQRSKERDTLAHALAIEMSNVLRLLEDDDPYYRLKLRYAGLQPGSPELEPIFVQERDYRLYLGSIGRIGLLPEALACDTIRFYSELQRLRDEIENYHRIRSSGGLKIDLLQTLSDGRNKLVHDAKSLSFQLRKVGAYRARLVGISARE